MLQSVSWQQYLTVLGITLALYYFLVIILYFRKDLVKGSRPGVPEDKIPAPGADPGVLLFSAVHELMEELKSVFHTAAKNDYPKEELLVALQGKLREYPQLKGTPFQVSINNHIGQEATEKCQAELTEEDTRNLW